MTAFNSCIKNRPYIYSYCINGYNWRLVYIMRMHGYWKLEDTRTAYRFVPNVALDQIHLANSTQRCWARLNGCWVTWNGRLCRLDMGYYYCVFGCVSKGLWESFWRWEKYRWSRLILFIFRFILIFFVRSGLNSVFMDLTDLTTI